MTLATQMRTELVRYYISRHVGEDPLSGEFNLDVRTAVSIWKGDPDEGDLLLVISPQSWAERHATLAAVLKRAGVFDQATVLDGKGDAREFQL